MKRKRPKYKKFSYYHDRFDIDEQKELGFRTKTLASYYNEEKNQLQIGMALVSYGDQFVKRKGRWLAALRAMNKPILILKITSHYKPEGVLASIANMLLYAR